MFRTARMSIIRGLFNVHTAMVYVIQLSSRSICSCSKAVYKPVWHIPLLSVQWINSWWWTNELSETCSVSWQNKFVKLVHLLLFLLQSALQPLWVMACSTIFQYSQQEGFYRVLLPATRQTPKLEEKWLESSNSRHQVSLTSETTRANSSSGRWKLPGILPKVATSMSLLVLLRAVNLRHRTDGFTSPRKEGVLRIFWPENPDGFGRVWTRELGYQRPAPHP